MIIPSKLDYVFVTSTVFIFVAASFMFSSYQPKEESQQDITQVTVLNPSELEDIPTREKPVDDAKFEPHKSKAEPKEYQSSPARMKPPVADKTFDSETVESTFQQPKFEETADVRKLLPQEEAEVYDALVAEGEKLKTDGINAPSYRVEIDSVVLDELLSKGLARLIVKQRSERRSYRLSARYGEPRLARPDDLAGFSQRAIFLDSASFAVGLSAIRRKYQVRIDNLKVLLLLRDDLDSLVLAAQNNYSAALGLSLEEVKRTDGRFRMSDGIPFDYEIMTLQRRGLN